MNVYDFDNTIYKGESAVDFFFFCVKKHPSLIRFLPLILDGLIKYKLCKIGEEEIIESTTKFLKAIHGMFTDTDELVCEFWDKHEKKIKPFYNEIKREDDLLISASFDALLDEICRRMGLKNYISSELDISTFEVKSLCFGKAKVKRFIERYGNMRVENFYTDSKNDMPMIEASQNAFLVKGNRIIKIK